MTLVELMVSTGITVIVMAMAVQVVISVAGMSRDVEERIATDSNGIIAMSSLTNALQLGGMGASGGLEVGMGATRITTNSVVAQDGAGLDGSDVVYAVVPHRSSFGLPCSSSTVRGDVGAAVAVQQAVAASGQLLLRCEPNLPVLSSGAAKHLMLVSNGLRAALITGIDGSSLTTSGSYSLLNYAERTAISGFSNDPSKGAFTAGDLVYPVTIRRFFLAPGPEGANALFVQEVLPASSGSFPFASTGTPPRLISTDIEDLQIAFGVDSTDGSNPNNITWQAGLGGTAFVRGVRSMRVSLVSRSRRSVANTSSGGLNSGDYQPLTVEGHTATGTADGHRRRVYTKRIELPNMAPLNL